jgi:oligosaccharide repeat unit polymerase
VFIIILGAMAIAIQKGDARSDAPLSENLEPVFEGFVLYTAGGIVAFDRVVRQPSIVPHNWQISNTALEVANKVGGHFAVPSLRAEYVDVGPAGIFQNVYTIYFAYFDLGTPGMMICMAFYGLAVTLFYRKAIGGSKISIIMYSFFFASVLLTPFAEYFFMGWNFSIKIFIVAWLVYELPTRMRQMGVFLGRVTSKHTYL